MNRIFENPQLPANRETFQMDYKAIPASLKSAAIITALAAAVLGSACLGYQNPSRWWLTTFSVSIVNLYLLPKVLHYGNQTMIKMALVINLTALGSLSLGGIGVWTHFLGKNFITLLKTHEFLKAFSNAFVITSLLGYGIPLFQSILRKAYEMLDNRGEWQERILQLKNEFHNMPEMGLGFLQTNLFDNFVLQICLIIPGLMSTIFGEYSNYIQSMNLLSNTRMTMNEFKDIIERMEVAADHAGNGPEAQKYKDMLHSSLKLALRLMNKKDLTEAVSLLLSSAHQLIPNNLSKIQFFAIFQEQPLDIANTLIQQFLDSINGWNALCVQYRHLEFSVNELKRNIDNSRQGNQSLSDEQKRVFSEIEKQLNREFSELRTKVEKIYHNKRIWQDFISIGDLNLSALPFENGQRLLTTLNNIYLLASIDRLYGSIFKIGSRPDVEQQRQNNNQHIADSLERIRSILQQGTSNPVSSIIFLGANQDFKQADIKVLQRWLHLDSPHDIDETMEKIGLINEDDFYEANIIPRERQILTDKSEIEKKEIKEREKQQTLINLHNYILTHSSQLQELASRIQQQNEVNQARPAYTVIEKVTRVVYHAITSGIILAPVFIHPVAGSTGIAVGVGFYILKRFNFPGTQEVSSNFNQDFFETSFFGRNMYSYLRQRVFTIDNLRRENANQFINADFFGRMRRLNLQMSHFILAYYTPAILGMGYAMSSFMRGIAIADEFNELVLEPVQNL